MKTDKPIILLIGKSGSGKTTLTKITKEKFNWQDIDSYTTRAPRHANEKGHIFISEAEFDKIPDEDMCAYTVFNGYRYCATMEQADKADIYVIDVDGADVFKKRYTRHNPDRKIITVYLEVPDNELRNRMKKRNDSQNAIDSRIKHDKKAFATARQISDYVLDGCMSLEDNANISYRLSTTSKQGR